MMNTTTHPIGKEGQIMRRLWVSIFLAIVVSVILFCFGWLFFPKFYNDNVRLMFVNLFGCIALQILTLVCIEYGKAREID